MALCSNGKSSFSQTAKQITYLAGNSLVLNPREARYDCNCSSRCSSQAIPSMNCNSGNIVGHALEAWTHRDLDLQTLAENPDKHAHNTDTLSFHVHTCASLSCLWFSLTSHTAATAGCHLCDVQVVTHQTPRLPGLAGSTDGHSTWNYPYLLGDTIL